MALAVALPKATTQNKKERRGTEPNGSGQAKLNEHDEQGKANGGREKGAPPEPDPQNKRENAKQTTNTAGKPGNPQKTCPEGATPPAPHQPSHYGSTRRNPINRPTGPMNPTDGEPMNRPTLPEADSLPLTVGPMPQQTALRFGAGRLLVRTIPTAGCESGPAAPVAPARHRTRKPSAHQGPNHKKFRGKEFNPGSLKNYTLLSKPKRHPPQRSTSSCRRRRKPDRQQHPND